ncbi:MAG: PEP-CTERM sorting domain-containing protein [Phycisphaerae bacterium]
MRILGVWAAATTLCAAASADVKAYSWTFDPRVPIPDAAPLDPNDPNSVVPGFAFIPLPIPDAGTVTAIEEVCIDIEHTFVSDLTVGLIGPDGITDVELIDGDFVLDSDGVSGLYCFREGAPAFGSITNGTLIPTGTYGPNDDDGFSDFIGIEKFGTWQLGVFDLVEIDVGSIGGVSIRMENVPEPGTMAMVALAGALLARRRR